MGRMPFHHRGGLRRRFVVASITCLGLVGLVGSVPHHHHPHRRSHERMEGDGGVWAPEPDDPAFALSIEERVSIIFM